MLVRRAYTTPLTVNSPMQVKPVCWTQCWNAYTDCFYNSMHTTLMCSEYIKAGYLPPPQQTTREQKKPRCCIPRRQRFPGTLAIWFVWKGMPNSDAKANFRRGGLVRRAAHLVVLCGRIGDLRTLGERWLPSADFRVCGLSTCSLLAVGFADVGLVSGG